MNIIVVGCGRVGSRIAGLFADNGHNVVVIDNDPTSFLALGHGFNGRTVVGIGYDEPTLVKAGIRECDVVTAVTNLDNSNLMTVEVARKLFGVKHVIARLYNPNRETTYSQLGIDYVSGTSLVAEEIFGKVLSGHSSHIDTFGDFELLRFSLDLSGRKKDSIKVKQLEREHDIRIIAFERKDSSASSIPSRESILYQDDSVIACVRNELVDAFTAEYIQHE